eukprot:CAMPEP_0172726956 /NCGR_PEP_ID=MMETSP1074-20121228/91403_1 /TAXON_ID=2916 /ORGANISM="Ceratium fusus, Strain PA161109" /LENGTH=156 /DNA_ID=CAMNT_0013554061 /DNA_START=176 /DNA_END=646 /DNA_ORIENTATION=+
MLRWKSRDVEKEWTIPMLQVTLGALKDEIKAEALHRLLSGGAAPDYAHHEDNPWQHASSRSGSNAVSRFSPFATFAARGATAAVAAVSRASHSGRMVEMQPVAAAQFFLHQVVSAATLLDVMAYLASSLFSCTCLSNWLPQLTGVLYELVISIRIV